MNFLNVYEARNRFCELIRKVQHDKQIVITKSGHPVAVLEKITEDSLMDLVLARHPVFRHLVEQRYRKSLKNPGENINNVINKLKSKCMSKVSSKHK